MTITTSGGVPLRATPRGQRASHPAHGVRTLILPYRGFPAGINPAFTPV